MSARRWTFGLIVAAACGFQPGPRENVPIPPDGLGPYRETGTLALCQAGVALLPTGTDLAGFCVPSDAGDAASCTRDDQCASRERCSCGRCVVPFCTGNESCRSGETCVLGSSQCGIACAIDEDCAGGDACDRGRCAQPCTEIGQCQRGEICSRGLGVCVAIACTADDDCASDERCEGQRARRDLAEPAVVRHGGEEILFVADVEANVVLRGRGQGGDAFEIEPAPLVEDARAPAPIADGDGFTLYYASADRSALLRVTGAESSPGDPEELFSPEQDWEGGMVDAPSAARFEGRLVLAYEGATGIGLAVEDAGGGWSGRDAPVVTAQRLEDPVLWREVSDVGSPMIVPDRTPLGDARLLLWVDARGAEGAATVVGPEVIPPPINASIATLVSVDGGASFSPAPFNPTFARVAELGRYKAESDPWIAWEDDVVRLWFVGADVDDARPEGLGVARSSGESLE